MTTMSDARELIKDSAFGPSQPEPVSARETVNAMVEAGLFDGVMAKVASGR